MNRRQDALIAVARAALFVKKSAPNPGVRSGPSAMSALSLEFAMSFPATWTFRSSCAIWRTRRF
jgi:hypothetical protein